MENRHQKFYDAIVTSGIVLLGMALVFGALVAIDREFGVFPSFRVTHRPPVVFPVITDMEIKEEKIEFVFDSAPVISFHATGDYNKEYKSGTLHLEGGAYLDRVTYLSSASDVVNAYGCKSVAGDSDFVVKSVVYGDNTFTVCNILGFAYFEMVNPKGNGGVSIMSAGGYTVEPHYIDLATVSFID